MIYKLTDLNAEINTLEASGRMMRNLWFECPKCPDKHWHMVPFDTEMHSDGGFKVWKYESGDSTENLTLSPSYNLINTACMFHCMIQDGEVRVV